LNNGITIIEMYPLPPPLVPFVRIIGVHLLLKAVACIIMHMSVMLLNGHGFPTFSETFFNASL